MGEMSSEEDVRRLKLEVRLLLYCPPSIVSEPFKHYLKPALVQVLRLETKLRDLHASDLVATRRALTTLQQHVGALQQDSEVQYTQSQPLAVCTTLLERAWSEFFWISCRELAARSQAWM